MNERLDCENCQLYELCKKCGVLGACQDKYEKTLVNFTTLVILGICCIVAVYLFLNSAI